MRISPRAAALAAILLIPPAARADRPPVGPEPWIKVAASAAQRSAGRSIRQRAFDGDDATAYRSAGPARAGDHLTLTFDEPAIVRGIGVATGGPGGADTLVAGSVEVAEDGSTFAPVAPLDAKGRARADFPERPIRAVRVRVARDLKHPLVVREFRIDAGRVRPFRHPVEFAVDSREAPELQAWADETARLCEEWYDALNDATTLADARPSDRVALVVRPDYWGVAATDAAKAEIAASARFFARRPAERGALIAETTRVIQNYPRAEARRAPEWLAGGMGDYARFFVFEPGRAGPIPPRQARHDGGGPITATFLDFVARTYDRQLVPKLDRELRAGTYREDFFRMTIGKPLADLEDEWRASLGLSTDRAAGPGSGPTGREPGRPVGEVRGDPRGVPFRDEARGRLSRVVVFGGAWIDSIACTWSDGRADAVGALRGGDGGVEQAVDLEPGESLVQVSGVIREDGDRGAHLGHEVVGSLVIRTNRRTLRRVGEGTTGRRFNLEAPKGQEICGFRGRTGEYVNALGILCRPIP